MEKIALIARSHLSDWVSCRSITRNLSRSYHEAFPESDVRSFHLNEGTSRFQAKNLATEIHEFSPDTVSFIDHAPHPGDLLRFLKAAGPLPAIQLHAFGDFTLHPGDWLGCEDILKDARIKFIGASEKQANLIKSFLLEPGQAVEWIPFPVESSDFHIDSVGSSSCGSHPTWRSRSGAKDSDTVFLYTGRLSQQKNVLFLITCFSSYLTLNPDARLWLAGPVDDLGVPYLGKVPPSGFLITDIIRTVTRLLPESHRARITYFGDLHAEELKSLYREADTFISFSTHNDEDFGMAPAEAACCGLPLVLSDWGGYSSFQVIGPDRCQLVPVSVQGHRLAPSPIQAVRAMVQAGAQKASLDERKTISRSALNFCSRERVSARLRATLKRPPPLFPGFSTNLRQMAAAHHANPKAPFRTGTGYSKLFEQLYAPYF